MSAAGSQGKTVWTVLELLRWTTDHFRSRGITTARLDAECLLGAALGVPRMRLYIDFDKPVGAQERGVFREFVKRRANERMPVSQLVGIKEFWSMELAVTRDVLTPRPDTETLVSAALDLLRERDAPVRVLDIGTGSGCVALAIARERPNASITATDVSPAALKLAAANAESVGVAERIEFAEGSLYGPVRSANGSRRFDLVVSNPPYLAESERASLPPELAHEPDVALFAGSDGLALLRDLVAGASEVLVPGGGFAVEVSPAQAPIVSQWCREAGLVDASVHRDLASQPRAVSAKAPSPPNQLPPVEES